MNGKKVIFVGGTSYSGSTFFDMILGNDPRGFSCGEVNALFYPYRKHHINPICGCGKQECVVWKEVVKNGVCNLYETIFSVFPELEYIVDSSKDPFWIEQQSRNLVQKGICVKNILIWKAPYEFAYSYRKRGRNYWEKEWINYHKLYFSLVNEWKSVKYSDLAKKPEKLKDVCDYLGINYFDNKHEYWNKKHHILFGNNTAKIHLYNQEDPNYKRVKNNIDPINKIDREKKHRKINYQEIKDKELLKDVERIISLENDINRILGYLEICDSSENTRKFYSSEILMSSFEIMIRRIKYFIRKQLSYNYYAKRYAKQ